MEISDKVKWALKKFIPILLFVFIIIGGVSWIIRIASQPGEIVKKTLDADNVLYKYEWFKQTYQDVKAIALKIKNAEAQIAQFKHDAGDRPSWSFEDKNEHNRLNTILLGLRNQREDVVATYNARSKMANRAIFKTGELPEQIN